MAKEGFSLIALFLVATLILGFGYSKTASPIFFGLMFFFALVTLFTCYFFRDPERTIPQEPGIVVSPADGRVVEIEEDTHEYTGKAVRVSIFLNVFNVHINRIPEAGTIEYVRYYKGKFLAAWDHKASLDNEQSQVGMVCNGKKILFKQIAGLIARRIVCKAREGQIVARGDRFGLIKFGSRTDLFLPLGSQILVKVGDKVAGGSSVIATLRE